MRAVDKLFRSGKTYRVIPERLREARTEKKFYQKTIASMLQISQPTLTNYENGNASPAISTLLSLSLIYDVSIEWLCGETDDKTQNLELIDTSKISLDDQITMSVYKALDNDSKEAINIFLHKFQQFQKMESEMELAGMDSRNRKTDR